MIAVKTPAALLLTTVTLAGVVTGVEVNKGVNAAAYALMCGLVEIAQQKAPKAPTNDNIKQISAIIAAVNLIVQGGNVTKNAIDRRDKPYSEVTYGEPVKKVCTEPAWDFCKAGAEQLHKTKDSGEYKVWEKLQGNAAATARMKIISESMQQLRTKAAGLNTPDQETAANKALAGALFGDGLDNEKSKNLPAGGSHVELCGAADGATGGTATGKSLKHDFICLCGKTGKDAGNGLQACAAFDTNPAVNIQGCADINGDWAKISKGCQKAASKRPPTPAAIHAQLAAFYTAIVTPEGTGFNRYNTLGHVDGAGTTGCDGAASATGGKWVQYKAAEISDGSGPEWAVKLRDAAAAVENIQQQKHTMEMLEQQAHRLNDTMNSLLHEPTDLTPQNTEIKPQVLPQMTENDCKKHQSKTECKEPCQWNENTTDKTKKCSLNHKKAAEQQATQTNTAGKGEKPKEGEASSGCAKHGTKADCENDKTCDKQNCAWRKGKDNEDDKETEKCRNGSFL
uniref:Variant surface glycoprotein 1125.207 n=1 Tax=Trypanosoma brucei TaxID=5691 RepID=A0A1J0R5E8_9TRYP|nr:variant surface glycoprotein 1125.207 [Trypanosoma brucei]